MISMGVTSKRDKAGDRNFHSKNKKVRTKRTLKLLSPPTTTQMLISTMELMVILISSKHEVVSEYSHQRLIEINK